MMDRIVLLVLLVFTIHHGHGQHVCYPTIGCFDVLPPFNNTGILPQDPGFIHTVFKLYTRQHHDTPQDITPTFHGDFNPALNTKIIIHGFLQDYSAPWLDRAAKELLRKDVMNVIVVGWGHGAGFPYSQAASNTRVVGAVVGHFVNSLLNTTSLQAIKVHLIGHSLGAHVSGYAGNLIPGLGRITGLDPAQPNFIHTPNMVHLDKTDARYVDVIHTDGSTYNTFSGYGMLTAVGHADFYPNGGIHQPGCGGETYMDVMSNAFSNGVESAENHLGCSHDRACDLFIESINGPCSFISYPCSSKRDFDTGKCLDCSNRFCPRMGLDGDQYRSKGTFYLQTNDRAPFCGNHYYVEFSVARQVSPGTIKLFIIGSSGRTQHILFNSGTVAPSLKYKKLFFSSVDVGRIQSVSMSYASSSNHYSWFSFGQSIVVQKVIAQSLKRDERYHFCGRKYIKSGRTVLLEDGTRHPAC